MTRQRIRIRYSKQGRLKFIGHNDLLRTLEALFRRARLPLARSGGFHPKVKMSFPGALALGYESLDEVLEIELEDNTELAENAEPVDADSLLADLNRQTIEGLIFLSAHRLEEGSPKVCLASTLYQMTLPAEWHTQTAERVEAFLAETSAIVTKTNGKPVDVRAAVLQMVFDAAAGLLTIELRAQTGPEAGVREVLSVLGLRQELFVTLFPKRIRCRLADEDDPAANKFHTIHT